MNKITAKYYIIIFLISSTVYIQTISFDLVWDDIGVISYNKNIYSLSNALKSFVSVNSDAEHSKYDPAYSIATQNYRPVRTLMHAFIYKFWKTAPWPYHFLNIILHSMTCLLLFAYLSRVLMVSMKTALYATLIFAVHPLTTETVCWSKSAEDLLATGLILTTLLLFAKSNKLKNKKPLSLSLFFYLIALFTKISAGFIPLWLLFRSFVQSDVRLTAFSFLSIKNYFQKFYNREKDLIHKILPLFLITIFFIILRHSILGRTSQGGYLTGSCWTTWLSMPRVLLRYLRLFIFPFDLLPDYQGYPVASSMLDIKSIIYTFVLLCLFSFISIYLFKRKMLTGWVWFCLSILPFIQIIPLLLIGAERFLYIPFIGSIILLAQIIDKFSAKRIFKYSFFVIFPIYFLFTISHSRIWSNEISLWIYMYNYYPESPRTLRNYGKALLNKNKKALTIFRKLIQIQKTNENYMLLGFS